MKLIYLAEALRFFKRRVRVGFVGVRKYSGDDEEICRKIIRACYNSEKNYFMVSAGHFCEFYSRDFGWCAKSLISLGYKKEVVKTLEYALEVFQRHGKVEQAISPQGRAFTFPDEYSPDALAFLVHALRVAGDKSTVSKYRDFLETEVGRYYSTVVEPRTGLVRKDAYFSSIKDYSLRKSSCYDTCMTAMLREDLKALHLNNPFGRFDYENILLKHYWTGSYFLDDLSGSRVICGDANIFPFWCGIVNEKNKLALAVSSIKKAGLDKPFALKYTAKRQALQKMILIELLAGDYERDSVWAHLGLIYAEVAAALDNKIAAAVLHDYKARVLEHKNFIEVYNARGKPFNTLLYYTDDSLLWCANYLALKKKIIANR